MNDLTIRRQFFAEEIAAVADIRTPGLIEAMASVPREQFLGPGPWLVRGEGDVVGGGRQTPSDEPRHVYHNYSIAIDPARQLFNGAPGLVAGSIDKLALQLGARVLHVGAGLGYYSALIGHTVGPTGRVVAIEVDPSLAAAARRNLSSLPWIDLQIGDGTGPLEGAFDGILVNVGVTHPQDAWLDALAPGGRLILPLTIPMGPPQTGTTIGKGIQVLLTRGLDDMFTARVLTFVAIYSGIGLRDETLAGQLGQALMRAPFPIVKRLRRDAHEPAAGCWYHTNKFCFD